MDAATDTGAKPDKASKKILLVYASAGAGHKIACKAVEQAIKDNGFTGDVKSIDTLQYMPKPIARIFSEGYLWAATKVPSLWYLIYESGGSLSRFSPISNWQASVLKILLRKVNHLFQAERPDYIISTYFTSSWLAGRYKALHDSNCRAATIVTDYGIHPTWVVPNQNRYFVPSEDIKTELSAFEWYTKVNGSHIVISGIPVEKRFTVPHGRTEMRLKHGLTDDKFTVLILAGVYDLHHIETLIKSVIKCQTDIQIMVVAKREYLLSASLKNKLEEKGIVCRMYGRINFMEELTAAADIAISKTGGLTSSECFNSGCPLFAYMPYPGQEERNASYFLEKGAAWRIYQLESLAEKIDYLASHPEKHHAMVEAARQVIRPNAADMIARTVLSDLE